MDNSQERKEEAGPAGHQPADQSPRGRSGEGAASALEQLISQSRQRDDGRLPDDHERG